ncbi:MAG: hypothetical protein OP8BY_1734 [Candidatus Saccharicenans subterraneus]|uniref:Uncharacterized protein n=1 Tax=Candidatus Saccharicenans subterraneus TaxID=2508984 RepID=A0A3E2BPJ3_9BACT|nr:MAG: hypothetical protein OP8BY_1734 [Candidatus Saccharicenans subterraneum]
MGAGVRDYPGPAPGDFDSCSETLRLTSISDLRLRFKSGF